ncbi:unnamed protein product [Linum trigynum]|uniref:Uncharacterized protein n=1 Tax=Linum trigynum TaxID=586398 RepID=A0AAV2DDF2_9ROSI
MDALNSNGKLELSTRRVLARHSETKAQSGRYARGTCEIHSLVSLYRERVVPNKGRYPLRRMEMSEDEDCNYEVQVNGGRSSGVGYGLEDSQQQQNVKKGWNVGGVHGIGNMEHDFVIIRRQADANNAQFGFGLQAASRLAQLRAKESNKSKLLGVTEAAESLTGWAWTGAGSCSWGLTEEGSVMGAVRASSQVQVPERNWKFRKREQPRSQYWRRLVGLKLVNLEDKVDFKVEGMIETYSPRVSIIITIFILGIIIT